MANYNTPGMGTYGSAWQAYGYSGNGNVESLIGTLQDRPAIVVGSAVGVFDELHIAMSRLQDPVIFAVNEMGMFLPKVDHWVSLHSVKMENWINVRWDNQYVMPVTHSMEDSQPVGKVWQGLNPLLALSGYFAMQIAYIMGASQIILTGCPGLARRRIFDAEARTDFHYGGSTHPHDVNVRQQLVSEMNRLPDFKTKVRSMSGWTKDYFGYLYQHKEGKNGSLRNNGRSRVACEDEGSGG